MVRSLLSRLFGGGSSADGGGESATRESAADHESHGTDEEEAGEDDPAEDANDLWDLIPSWEYDGKYVQSGGHSRGEQERALADIQRQAEEIEHSESGDEPHPDQ